MTVGDYIMNILPFNNGVEMSILGFGTYQIIDSVECGNTVVSTIRAVRNQALVRYKKPVGFHILLWKCQEKTHRINGMNL